MNIGWMDCVSCILQYIQIYLINLNIQKYWVFSRFISHFSFSIVRARIAKFGSQTYTIIEYTIFAYTYSAYTQPKTTSSTRKTVGTSQYYQNNNNNNTANSKCLSSMLIESYTKKIN